MNVPALVFTLVWLVLFGSIGHAQRAGGEHPIVLTRLIGDWQGNGTVTGRASAVTMTWSTDLEGTFVHLRFRNAMAPGAGRPAEAFEGRGYYRVTGTGGTGVGTWIDSRGVILPLSVAVTPDSLTTEWGQESTERGRTVYRLSAADTVEILDFVRGPDGQFREFGRTTLTRRR